MRKNFARRSRVLLGVFHRSELGPLIRYGAPGRKQKLRAVLHVENLVRYYTQLDRALSTWLPLHLLRLSTLGPSGSLDIALKLEIRKTRCLAPHLQLSFRACFIPTPVRAAASLSSIPSDSTAPISIPAASIPVLQQNANSAKGDASYWINTRTATEATSRYDPASERTNVGA